MCWERHWDEISLAQVGVRLLENARTLTEVDDSCVGRWGGRKTSGPNDGPELQGLGGSPSELLAFCEAGFQCLEHGGGAGFRGLHYAVNAGVAEGFCSDGTNGGHRYAVLQDV